MWWFGTALNAVGELGNLIAYGYAEATVITPIGAVGVIVSALIATLILKEPFRLVDVAGFGCIIRKRTPGSVHVELMCEREEER